MRRIVILMLMAGPVIAAGAQQSQTSDAYQGVSQPPNDPIVTSQEPVMKPRAGVVVTVQPLVAPTPAYVAPRAGYQAGSADVPSQVMPGNQLETRGYDPDGDVVHPRVARPGELLEGATIRVRLQDRLSSALTEKGEPFRGQVAFDVLQDGNLIIPAGSWIEGRVSAVSSGHFAGHGSLRLKPEVVILPNGSRYELHAETTGTQGTHTRMGAEGAINPGSRAKKDALEYGAVVGTGAVTGAILGGPAGALAGSLIGAGIVTTHLMTSHPQATLEPGAMILFTTTGPMQLQAQ